MWYAGNFVIDGIPFQFEAKVFREGSELGINGGRISKLQVVYNNCDENMWSQANTFLQYNRGWDIKPENELADKVLDYILELYK